MPVNPVFLNGKWLPLAQANISPLDRGFLFGDGCYEIIPIYHKKIFRLDDHIRRLNYSLQSLQIESNYTSQQWIALFTQLVDFVDDDVFKAYIYLQVSRGVGSKRDHTIGEDFSPTIFSYVEHTDFPVDSALPREISVRLLEDFRWHRGDIKAISLLGSVMARKQAMDDGYDDCIFYRDGEIVETSASNLFIVENGVVKTPPLSNLLLGGITRLVVLELLKKHNILFSVEAISLEQLHNASEVWLTSSIKELVPITRIDGKPVANAQVGPVLPKIWQHWQQYLRSYAS